MMQDLISSVMGTIGKQKDILVDVLAREIKNFLAKVNISDELKKALQGMTINLNASFDFEDKKKQHKSKKISVKKRTGRK